MFIQCISYILILINTCRKLVTSSVYLIPSVSKSNLIRVDMAVAYKLIDNSVHRDI